MTLHLFCETHYYMKYYNMFHLVLSKVNIIDDECINNLS